MNQSYNLYLPKESNLDTLIDTLNKANTSIESNWYLNCDPLTETPNTPTLEIPNTFRFSTWISLLPSTKDDNLYIAIIEIQKTSRIHDFDYSDGIDDMCYNAEHLKEPLDTLTKNLISIGAIKEYKEKKELPKNGKIPFSIGDQDQFLVTLMCATFDSLPKTIDPYDVYRKTYNDERLNTDTVLNYNDPLISNHMVINHILYTKGFTHEAIQTLLNLYAKQFNKNNNPIMIETKSQVIQLLSLIPELPLYKEAYKEVKQKIKQHHARNIESAVIDKQTKKAYPAEFGHHYITITHIIAEHYSDQFLNMTQNEKDNFILTNFEFIGQNYNNATAYVPKIFDVERLTYKYEKNERILK